MSEAQMTGQQDVLEALGGLPDESRHCALLAASTLKAKELQQSRRRIVAIQEFLRKEISKELHGTV